MIETMDLTIALAFGAGVISFLSPCTLPLFPAYLSYITGVSVKDIDKNQRQVRIQGKLLIHAIAFLLGVSVIFFSFGVGVSLFGGWLQGFLTGSSGVLIQRITGILLIVIGAVVGGWLTIPALMKERRVKIAKKPIGLVGSFFVGIGFSAGWTPCIGPIFASILLLAGTNPTQGLLYTSFYIIGFAFPFLLLTFFLGYAKWLVKYSEKIAKIGGSLIILFGFLLFTGYLARFSNFLLKIVQDSWFSNLG